MPATSRSPPPTPIAAAAPRRVAARPRSSVLIVRRRRRVLARLGEKTDRRKKRESDASRGFTWRRFAETRLSPFVFPRYSIRDGCFVRSTRTIRVVSRRKADVYPPTPLNAPRGDPKVGVASKSALVRPYISPATHLQGRRERALYVVIRESCQCQM